MRPAWAAMPFLLLSLLSACGGSQLSRPEGIDPSAQVEGAMTLGQLRLRASVCEGIDTRPDYATLDERSLTEFLKQRGFPFRTIRPRSDLLIVELQINPERDKWLPLRVAILQSSPQAGAELHRAELEHGPGSWGVRRANLAVLGPIGELDDVVAVVARTKLACWGMLSATGRDDDFAIPGGYREL